MSNAKTEISVKDEYDTNRSPLNCGDLNNPFHKEKDHSCFYNSSSSVPKTILITNNYSQDDPIGLKNHQNIQKSSSITIVTHNSDSDHSTNNMPTSANSSTVVVDRINICINNHFNDCVSTVPKSSSLVSTEKKYSDDVVKEEKSSAEPDSTTSNVLSLVETVQPKLDENVESYSNGQDVLVQRKDGRFYLGTIIGIACNQCLVKFDDNTEYWSLFDQITKLSSNDSNNDPMCVVCKKVNSNDVVDVCERCGRGYHQKCAEGSFQKNGDWFCRRCTARNGFKFNSEKSIADKQSQAPRIESSCTSISHKSQLPYDIDSLSWDKHHRVNLEQIYCYCGGNGEWHNKMLQCCKCQQWFHENCIRCLDYPIYRGDRFFVFACSMCNHGTEFLRRLVMGWTDIVHLLLFNITSYNQKKYYHVNKVIVPYAIDNWPMLQLRQSMQNLPPDEIKFKIISTLSSSKIFQCGREIKKRQSAWGLRDRIPPRAPIVTPPWEIEINEQYLKQRAKIDFLPLRFTMAIPKDVEIKMSGAVYLDENSDNESTGGISDTKFTSDDELPLKISIEKEKKMLELINPVRVHFTDPIAKEGAEKLFPSSSESSDKSRDSGDFSGGGAGVGEIEIKEEENLEDDSEIKKITTFEVVANIKRNRKRKSPFLSSTTTAASDTIKKHVSDIIDICDSSDDTSSRGTLDLIIPPPKNFQGRNNPFRLTPKKNDNNNIDKIKLLSNNNGATSSSSGSSNKNVKAVKQSILGSKLFGKVDFSQAAGQFRIVRTVKRRLSAKDITIGPNKEVKRRRLKRRSGDVEVISTGTIQTLPISAAYLPIRSDSKDWPVAAIRSSLTSASSSSSSTPQATTPTNLGAISNVFNGRRLRQRQGKNYAESSRRNSNSNLTTPCTTVPGNINIPGSPNKVNSQTDVSFSELKTSVNIYFGAANRIANGENFVVRAKRFAPNGKVQYLIEWEGLS